MADAAMPGTEEQVFRLIYRSHNLIDPADRKVVLGKLFSQARSNNKGQQITGALLVSGDWFAQILEGDEAQVKNLYEKIQEDNRHDRIALLNTVDKTERLFSRWAMARVSEDGEPDIPLIAHADGISPAAGHKISPEQEFVLGFMRESVSTVDLP